MSAAKYAQVVINLLEVQIELVENLCLEEQHDVCPDMRSLCSNMRAFCTDFALSNQCNWHSMEQTQHELLQQLRQHAAFEFYLPVIEDVSTQLGLFVQYWQDSYSPGINN